MGLDLDVNHLLDAGDSYHRKKYREQEEIEITRDYSHGIPVARDIHTGELIRIKPGDTTRIFLCAKTGQGKTVLAKSFISRFVDMGGNVFVGGDVKNDFQSFNYSNGVSKELRDNTQGLLRGEEPRSLDRNLGVPRFLTKYYQSSPRSYATVFSIGFQDISEQDFKYLIGYHGWRSETQQNIVDDILSKHDISDLTWELLWDELDEHGSSGGKIKRNLRSLRDTQVISSKGDSIESFLDFDSVNLCSLGLKGIDEFTFGGMEKINFYSALLHRRFIEKCRRGELGGPRLIFNDEAHELMPASGDSAVKEEFKKIMTRMGRQAGITTMLSTQEPSQVPSDNDSGGFDFVSDTTHAFVGKGLNWSGYKTVFQVFRVYDSHNTEPLRRLKDSLGDHQFLFLDESMESASDVRVVESLAPLTAHPG